MSDHPTDFQGDVLVAIREAITARLPQAQVQVEGGGGHYTIGVVDEAFRGKGPVDAQRMVYGAIAHLMKGDRAPVHAVDKLVTKTP